jgi:hypothetical protein
VGKLHTRTRTLRVTELRDLRQLRNMLVLPNAQVVDRYPAFLSDG